MGAKKKAMGEAKRATKEAIPLVRGTDVQLKRPADIAQARENVVSLIRDSATEIATAAIEKAIAGELASAKYLFELAGLHPAKEETMQEHTEDSQAFALLRRMALPTGEVICDNDEAAGETARAVVEDARSDA